NNKGDVFALDHKGKVERHYSLPAGVKALVGDGAWMYAGCDNGEVFDISHPTPRLAYELPRKAGIDWIDIWSGVLAVSNNTGGLDVIDVESQSLWSVKGGGRGAWTARCDRDAIYHGHDSVTTAHARTDGKVLWETKTGPVMFGWQT